MGNSTTKMTSVLKLLSNEHRLQILYVLRDTPLTVGEIHALVPAISLSALSQHLGQMRLVGLLDASKHGLNVIYSIHDPEIFCALDALCAYTQH